MPGRLVGDQSSATSERCTVSDLQDVRAVIDLPGEWFLVAADRQEASGALADSPRELVPIRLASLVLLPGMPALAARRFGTHRGRTLVLHAIDESSRASVRW